MNKNIIRGTLFLVFVLAFCATVGLTLWSYGLHAGLLSTEPKTDDKFLGWMLSLVVGELVAGIVMLWQDVFGLRVASDPGAFEDIKGKLTKVETTISKLERESEPIEIGTLQERLTQVEASISDLKRQLKNVREDIYCSQCGRQIGTLNAALPGSRTIGCQICSGITRVNVTDTGGMSTEQVR